MDYVMFDPDFRSMNDSDYWDFRAKDYSEETSRKLDPPEEKAAFVQSFLEKGMIDKNSRVLDLGCGPGWYTRAFSREVGEVVGIDISENMLNYARENNKDRSNVSFVRMDWSDADVSGLGKFDLVFANMSPAIYDSRTLEKMMSVCSGYCWYSHFASRYCNVTQRLDEYFGMERKLDRIRLMFDYLWERGYLVDVTFQRKGGHSVLMPEQELIDYYRHEYHYSEAQDETIRNILRKFTKETGMIERHSWFDKGILCWKV